MTCSRPEKCIEIQTTQKKWISKLIQKESSVEKRVSRKPIRIYVGTIAEQNFKIKSQSELWSRIFISWFALASLILILIKNLKPKMELQFDRKFVNFLYDKRKAEMWQLTNESWRKNWIKWT